MKNRASLKIDILIFCVLAILFTTIYFVLPHLGLYANDGGLKYIQMKAFYLNGWKDYDIKYPGRSIGLDFEDLNLHPYLVERNGKIVSFYLPFVFLSSLFYPLLGERVIHFLPLVSFFSSIILLSLILRMLKPSRLIYYLLLFGFIFASPLYLYSITFWEHIPLVFLVTLSMYYLVRFFLLRPSSLNLSLAFIFLSLGLFLRVTALGLLLSLVLSIFLYLWFRGEVKKIMPALLCSACIVIIYAFLNHYLYGDLIIPYPMTFSFPYKYFLYLAAMLVITGLIFILLYRGCKEERGKDLVIGLLPILFVMCLAVSTRENIVGLFFVSFPLIAVLFFDFSTNIKQLLSKKVGIKQVFLLASVLFLLFMSLCLMNNPHRSMRFLLPFVPITFIFLCLHHEQIEKSRSIIGIILFLLFIGFVFNLAYLKIDILKYKFYNANRYEFIKESTKDNDIIIFPHHASLEHAGPLFFERIYLVCDNEKRTDYIMDKFFKKGISHFYIWSSSKGYKDYLSNKHRNYKIIDTHVFSSKYPEITYYLFEIAKKY